VRVQLSHYRLHTSASAASPPPKPTVYHPTLHSFLSSSPLSLLLLPSLHHPPPSLLPSLTPPSAAAVLHAPFLPTALSKPLRLCLPFRGPRTSTLLQSSSPRPQGAPFHLQHRPASGLPGQKRSLPLHPTYTRNTATYTHTHTHSPRTTHQNILGPAPSPSHNSASSLRPSFRRFHHQKQITHHAAFPALSAQLDIAHVIPLARAQTAPAAPLRPDPPSALHTPESSIPASDNVST
jgi:hypothetical protein